MESPLVQDTVWLQQPRFEEAESAFQHYLIHGCQVSDYEEEKGSSPLVKDILQIRQHIQTAMNNTVPNGDVGSALEERIDRLEQENQDLKQTVEELRKMISSLNTQLKSSSKNVKENEVMEVDSAPEVDDDDVDLFGDDDEEDEEAEKLRQERVQAYADKKAKKPALIAKSSVTLDVKPWDDETDMKKLEECVRSIVMDGLLWGASKLVPLAYGIRKLTIICVIEDDKVSLEDLEELLVAFEDYIQSMDIAAFQKI